MKTTQHHHSAWTDEEYDAVALGYQQGCIVHPLYSAKARFLLTRDFVPEHFTRIREQAEGSMKSTFSNMGLSEQCRISELNLIPMWKNARFTNVQYKLMFELWRTSAKCVDGVYRFAETEEVNQLLYDALDAHIRKLYRNAKHRGRDTSTLPTLDGVDIFKLRCMLGWGTTEEIRRAGFEPGRRRNAVLPPAVATHFKQVETIGDRYTALEQRVDALEQRLAALEGDGIAEETSRNHLLRSM